jgi:hypothetical protein
MADTIKLDQEVFNNAIELLCEAFEKDITEARAKIYYDTLKLSDDNDDITRMVPIVLEKCKYFPSIADIVSAINDIDYMQQLN